MIGNRPAGSTARSLRGRPWALPLLVMAVLYGLLAMHGLNGAPPAEGHGHRATGGASHTHVHEPAPESASASAAAAVAVASASTSAHGRGSDSVADHGHGHGSPSSYGSGQHAEDCECSGTGGHLAHADATCAASGTSGAPAMDGHAAGAATGPRPVAGLESRGALTGVERAPPSLHGLQLLRI